MARLLSDLPSTGTAFLTKSLTEQQTFSPEKFTAEQKRMALTARDFLVTQLLPRSERIERAEPGLMRGLMMRAGQEGLLAVDIPRRYGGLGMGLKMSALLAEQFSQEHSFFVTWGVQTGIGSLPIVYFASNELKDRYLAGIAAGRIIAAFAVTEAEAGSDIMSNQTWARQTSDGRYYILNGAKKWISNAGLADIFIVFAKTSSRGTRFTAFVVEANWEGVSIGPEERKMGIRGSSHCSISFSNVKIPSESVLWEPGKGPKIVSSTLIIGRLKLAAGCAGACIEALGLAAKHAVERRTFGRSLSTFGLIQKKLASMASDTYAVESMAFRTLGTLEDHLNRLEQQGKADSTSIQACIEEYAVEASIAKVFASEASSHVIDEGLQIFGGYGYMQGHPIERAYRDIRITRIYEGTNEINRLLLSGTFLREALPVLHSLLPSLEEQISFGHQEAHVPAELSDAINVLEKSKRMGVFAITKAAIKLIPTIEQEQEFLEYTADILISLYAIDSSLARAVSALHIHHTQAEIHTLMARLVTWRYLSALRNSIGALLHIAFEGEDLLTRVRKIHDVIDTYHIDIIRQQRDLAGLVITEGGYPLSTLSAKV